jgi:hypothetical protein
MSVKGLLYAAKTILIDEMPTEMHQADVRFDAKPQRWNADKFIGIWCGQWEPGPHNHGEQVLDELIGATFTITFATGVVPHDVIDEEVVYLACEGIEYWARRITAVLTKKRWEWMCLANEMAEAELCECDPEEMTDVFVAPATWAGNDPTPRLVGPDWFSADPGDFDEQDEAPYGLVMDVRFRDANRIQSIANMH